MFLYLLLEVVYGSSSSSKIYGKFSLRGEQNEEDLASPIITIQLLLLMYVLGFSFEMEDGDFFLIALLACLFAVLCCACLLRLFFRRGKRNGCCCQKMIVFFDEKNGYESVDFRIIRSTILSLGE